MLIDNWIEKKIGQPEADALTREKLEEYQLFKLRETINYAKKNSSFYAEHLDGIDPDNNIQTLDDLSKIPFTSPEILIEKGSRMICVSQGNISRIVTLDTSGSTGKPKRIFFTEEDQELTVDYFHYGMQVMVDRDDIFLVLLPCRTPGSVGDLLRMGLERDDVKVIPFGYPHPDESLDHEIIEIMRSQGVTSLVGNAPVIARLAAKSKGVVTTMKTALLSAEFVSDENIEIIERCWNCEVFEHYGMTETGLGGAMACSAHEGYHPREADLIFEIIDAVTGEVLPDGEFGELVFTTITRTGMPLIRYRTGDMTRWIPEPCPCGSLLRRLDRVRDRGITKKAGL